MNSQGLLDYNKHVDVTTLPIGINGLVAMGGNVWEWIDTRCFWVSSSNTTEAG